MTSLNLAKLKAMVHHIAATIPCPNLGQIKLHNILWFSDREAFLKLGKTITGDTYIRKPYGLISKSLQTAVKELVQDGALEVSLDYQGEYEKHDYHSLRPPTELPLSFE